MGILRKAGLPLLLAALCAPLLGIAPAQQSADETPTAFPKPGMNAYLSHEAMPQGATATLLITLDIASNFHIQLNDFLEVLADSSLVTLGQWKATHLDVYGADQVLRGRTALAVPFTIANDAPLGARRIPLKLGYQGCVEEPVFACFPPDEGELSVQVEVLPAGQAGRPANAQVFAAQRVPIPDIVPAAQANEPVIAAPESLAALNPEEESGEAVIDQANGGAAAQTGGAQAAAAQGGEQTGAAQTPAKKDLAGRLEEALGRRSFLAFLLVFVGGVLTSFTPCVYPMIPITISYVGGRARNRAQGFFLALFFVLGIAIMYSSLGILAASTGSIFGAAMQSPAVLVVVALIFAAMGASMLGAFNLALPSGMQGRMTEGAQRGGVIGAILMGMVTGLVASPCVGPVLVVLLAFVAKTGSIFLGFWLLFAFACGLGLLFLLLGTFAGAISSLPQAGGWMDTVKHVFGVILIGAAIYYVRSLIGPHVTALLAGAFIAIVGVFLGAFTPLSSEPGRAQLLRRSLGLLLFLSGAAIFLVWLVTIVGPPGFLRPARGPEALSGVAAVTSPGPGAQGMDAPGIPWMINDEDALARARAEHRPVVQDFYADWCVACVELDEKTWVDPAIIAESRRFTPIKMDFTRRDEFSRAATERYGIHGMPTVIFYDGSGTEVRRFFGFKPPEEVLAIMRSIE